MTLLLLQCRGGLGGSYDASLGDEGYHAYVRLITEESQGEPRLQGHAVVFLGQNLGLTSMNEAYAIQVVTEDPNDTCKKGDHVSNIISHLTK